MPQKTATLSYVRISANMLVASRGSASFKIVLTALATTAVYLCSWLYVVSHSAIVIEGDPYHGTWEIRAFEISYADSRWRLMFAPLEWLDRSLRPDFWQHRLSEAEERQIQLLLPPD